MTDDLVERAGELTLAAREEMFAFFRWRLRGEREPAVPVGLRDCLKVGCARKTPPSS